MIRKELALWRLPRSLDHVCPFCGYDKSQRRHEERDTMPVEGKQCIKCGSTRRNARRNCYDCQQRIKRELRANPAWRERDNEKQRERYALRATRPLRTDPCPKCGATDRYANGQCAPCARARQSAKYPDKPPGMTKSQAKVWRQNKRRQVAKDEEHE